MVKVSVIVIVLNGVDFICESVESAINQTLKDIEIIVVDGGSTDGTLDVVEKIRLRDHRVKVIHSEKRSCGYQNNLGIKEAKGKYVSFLEADDFYHPTMLEELYIVAERDQTDYVKSDFDMFITKAEGRHYLRYRILGSSEDNYNKVFRPIDNPDIILRDVNLWNGLYRRSFLLDNQIKANETLGAAFQDTGFVAQTFGMAKRAEYVHADSYCYRRDNDSSSVYSSRSMKFINWEFHYAYEYIKKIETQDRSFEVTLLRRFLDVFCGFYNRLPAISEWDGDTRNAIEDFRLLYRKWHDEIPVNVRARAFIDSSLSFSSLLDDIVFFDSIRKKVANSDMRRYTDFFKYVCRFNKTVIFGCGERGTTTYAFLLKNNYDGVIGFTDNNEKLWDTSLMNLNVFSPESAIKLFSGALILIANDNHWKEIFRQLVNAGVNEEYICLAEGILPHNAFELEISMEAREELGIEKSI